MADPYEQRRVEVWKKFNTLGHGSRTRALIDIIREKNVSIVPTKVSNVLNGRGRDERVLGYLEEWVNTKVLS